MTKLSRTKGANWERACCHLLRQAGVRAERNLNESRHGLESDLDVANAPLTVQCKTGANPSVWRAVSEADRAGQQTGGFAVALVHRDQRRPGESAQEIAAMPLDDWLSLVGLLKGMGIW
jgi:hypothetical protein